jgi:PH (Pleckstrin Homology) domain-containing protein/putative oligomerization/nucleic acid binding protein
MGYADGLLSTGERVVHREKQHWLVFVWGAKLAVTAILLGLVLLVLSQSLSADQRASGLGSVLGIGVAALVIGGIGVLAWHFLRYINQEYVLTNRRVIQVAGVLNKTSMDSSLEKINDARLSQSIFGRMFGFGDLDILTAAETGIERFRMIRNPVGFKKAMLDAKHEYERDVAGGSPAPSPPLRTEPLTRPPAPTAGPVSGGVGDDTVPTGTPGRPPAAALSSDDLTRTLSNLADLRDRGAISAEEYERKKADLLSRL